MTIQTKSLAAILSLIALAACSPGEEPSLISEAYARTTPASSDYGWRAPQSETAIGDGTVHEYY